MTLTDEWLEVYNDSVKNNEDFKQSIWWRLAVDVLPEGVDDTDPRVIEAIKDIKARLK
jgi:hypothetical protein